MQFAANSNTQEEKREEGEEGEREEGRKMGKERRKSLLVSVTGSLDFIDSLPMTNSGTQGKTQSLLVQIGDKVKRKSDEFLSQIGATKVKLENE